MTHAQRSTIQSPARPFMIGLCIGALLLNSAAPFALAGPQGAVVQAGEANIAQSGSTTTITAGHNAIIDYQSFNIAAHETVQFIQPSAESRVLNRVLNGTATQIDGQLLSNGQVYLINPAGIYFGNTAIVNVGHLTAAAGTLSNSDFLMNQDRFTQVSGSVINTGSIEGRTIALIGNHVANHGSIVAPDGMVTLTAGKDVYLARTSGGIMVQIEGGTDQGTHAVENTGSIDAGAGSVNFGASDVYTLAARHAGSIKADSVTISGSGGQVEVGGQTVAAGGDVAVDAQRIYHTGSIDVSRSEGTAGTIDLAAELEYIGTASSQLIANGQSGGDVSITSGGRLMTSGSIAARGEGDGGQVIMIGSDVTSLLAATLDVGSDTARAGLIALGRAAMDQNVSQQTVISAGSTLSADGVQGGTVNLWAQQNLHVHGNITSRGGGEGFIDVSSAGSVNISQSATLDTAGGTLLLDPANIIVTLLAPLSLEIIKLASGAGVTLADDDNFGFSVSLNGDGDLLLVGAPADDTGGDRFGAAYIFTLDPDNLATPVLQHKLTHGVAGLSFSSRADMGTGTDFNDAGDIFLLGAQAANTSFLFSYDPQNPGTLPVLRQSLVGGGSDVALNAAGNIAVTGTRGSSFHVYKLNTADLTQAPLASFDQFEAINEFAKDVALNGAGNLLAVGTSDADGGANLGTIHIYTLDPTDVASGVSFQQSIGNGDGGLTLSDGAFFGETAFNDAGTLLFGGAPSQNGGSAYIFSFDPFNPADTPTLIATLDGNNVPDRGTFFGGSIDSDRSGSLLAIGAYWDNTGGPTRGATHIIDVASAGILGSGFTDLPESTLLINPARVVALLDGNDLVLQANNDITIEDAIDATSNSGMGNLTLQAGRSIFIQSDIALRGSFEADANVDFNEGVVDAQRMSGAAVFLMSSETTINTSATNGDIEIMLGGGYGLTHSTSGDIDIENLNAGAGFIEIYHEGRTDGSGIDINGLITTSGNDDGDIEISLVGRGNEMGNIDIFGRIETEGGDVDISGPNEITMDSSASIETFGFGEVSLEAGIMNIGNGRGSIFMADGSTITTVGEDVGLIADESITLGQINIFGDNDDAVFILSFNGQILDGGDMGGADINGFDGETSYFIGARLLARVGIGNTGANDAIETQTAYIEAYTHNTQQKFSIGTGTMSIGFFAGSGNVTVSTPGDLTDMDGRYDIIADTVNLNIGGSVLNNAVAGNHASANPNSMDFMIANLAGSSFNISGADNSIRNATPIDVTITNGSTGSLISTTGTISIATTPVNLNAPLTIESDGAITLNGAITTAFTGAFIEIYSRSTVTINDSLTASDIASYIDISGMAGVSFGAGGGKTGSLSTVDWDIDVEAFDPFAMTAPTITMVDQTFIDGGVGWVSLMASGDITIGQVRTNNAFDDAIDLLSLRGSILDGGDTDTDLVAPNGGVDARADQGIGQSDALETIVAWHNYYNISANDIRISQTDSGTVTVDQIVNMSSGAVVFEAAGPLFVDGSIEANGGTISLSSTGDLELAGSLVFADLVSLEAGTDGTGNLFWSEPMEVIAADAINLAAGDGPGGATSAMIDAETSAPFFVNQSVTDGPDDFFFSQDASFNNLTDAGFTPEQFGLDGSIDGTNVTITIADGTLTYTAAGTFTLSSLLLETQTDAITLDGATTLNGLTVVSAAGITMIDGSSFNTGSGGVTIEAVDDIALSTIASDNIAANAIQVTSTGGSIINGSYMATNIVAPFGGAVLVADSGIGSIANPLKTELASLAFSNGATGEVAIDNSNAGSLLTLGNAFLADPGSASTGATSIANASPITIASSMLFVGDVTITAFGDPQTAGDDVQFIDSAFISVTDHSNRTVTINAGDDISLVNGGIVMTGEGTHTIALNADTEQDTQMDTDGGRISQNFASAALSASILQLQATQGIGQSTSARLFVLTDDLTAHGGAGSVFIRSLDSITSLDLTSDLAVDLFAIGSILDSDASVDIQSATVAVSATGDIGSLAHPILVDVPAAVIGDFTGTNVFVDLGSGDLTISTPINIAADNQLQAFTTSGNLFVNAPIMTTGNNSGIALTAGSSATISQPLSTTGSNSSIEITAAQDITIVANVSATGPGSDIDLLADQDIIINPAATVSSATGSIGITTDADLDMTGGLFTIDGTLDAPNIVINTRDIAHSNSTIDAGNAGRVTIQGRSDQLILLGMAPDTQASPLELDQSILSIITAEVLEIIGTNTTTDGITIAANIALSLVDTLRLTSASGINNSSNHTLSVNKLAMSAMYQIGVDTIVNDLAASSTMNSVVIHNTGDLMLTTVDGIDGLSSGPMFDINLEVLGSLAGDGRVHAPTGAAFILAEGPINLTGIFTVGQTTDFITDGSAITVTHPNSTFGDIVSFTATMGNPHDVTFQAAGTVTFAGFTTANNLSLTVPMMNMSEQIGSPAGTATFNGDITLTDPAWTVNGNNVTFNGRINSDNPMTPRELFVVLNPNANGEIRFIGTIGAGPNDQLDSDVPNGIVGGDDRPLSHLETSGDGVTIFESLRIVLDGSSAEFDNPARIANDLDITELGTGNVAFNGSVDATPDASPSLTINQSGGGDIIFNEPVGASNPLGGLNTSGGAGSQTIIQADITTTGSQNYDTPVNAAPGTTLTGADVNLNDGTTGTPPQIVEVALDNTNVAELLPGKTSGQDQGQQIGELSDLARALEASGITVPPAMRGTLSLRTAQRALDSYLLDQEIGAQFSAQGFVNFMARRANQRQALLTFMAVRDVLNAIANSDLPQEKKDELSQRVRQQMRPTGISADEFDAILNALPTPGTVAMAT